MSIDQLRGCAIAGLLLLAGGCSASTGIGGSAEEPSATSDLTRVTASGFVLAALHDGLPEAGAGARWSLAVDSSGSSTAVTIAVDGTRGQTELFFDLAYDPQRLTPALDKVIRIRAIQDFSPAVALQFALALKSLVRDELAEPISAGQVTAEELQQFDVTVEQLLLLAFNIYMQCREQLYELRVSEVRNQSARLLQRANILWTAPEQEDNSKESINTNPT